MKLIALFATTAILQALPTSGVAQGVGRVGKDEFSTWQVDWIVDVQDSEPLKPRLENGEVTSIGGKGIKGTVSTPLTVNLKNEILDLESRDVFIKRVSGVPQLAIDTRRLLFGPGWAMSFQPAIDMKTKKQILFRGFIYGTKDHGVTSIGRDGLEDHIGALLFAFLLPLDPSRLLGIAPNAYRENEKIKYEYSSMDRDLKMRSPSFQNFSTRHIFETDRQGKLLGASVFYEGKLAVRVEVLDWSRNDQEPRPVKFRKITNRFKGHGKGVELVQTFTFKNAEKGRSMDFKLPLGLIMNDWRLLGADPDFNSNPEQVSRYVEYAWDGKLKSLDELKDIQREKNKKPIDTKFYWAGGLVLAGLLVIIIDLVRKRRAVAVATSPDQALKQGKE